MHHILFLLILSCCFFGFSQKIEFSDEELNWIKNNPIIEYGYEPRWEPYEVYSNGEYSGIVGDYVKIIEAKTGLKMKPIPNLTWDQSMKGLINGSIMVVPSCVSTPERLKWLELTDPYVIDPIVIVAKNDASYFSTLEDMSGKSIALSKNYYTLELIKEKFPNIIINEFESIQECLVDVSTGESDAFVGNLNVITYYKNHYGFDDLRVVGTTPFKDNGISFAVNPEWKTLKDIVNKVFSQVSAHQQHEIRKKWIGTNQSNYFSTSFFIWSLFIFLSILVGFIIVYYWNRVLKRVIKRKKQTEQQLKKYLIEAKKSDEDKKVLLQEIHHRVKNNLQIVSSMLKMQASTIEDKGTISALKDAVDRVQTIALVHDKIYKSESIAQVNLTDYITSLLQDVRSQYPNKTNVEMKVNSALINISMNSLIPMALIINELISNSFKHAFENQQQPKVTVKVKWYEEKKYLEMVYMDNGNWKEDSKSDHFGTSLIDIFTEQIDGKYSLNSTEDGTTYTFEFKNMDISAPETESTVL